MNNESQERRSGTAPRMASWFTIRKSLGKRRTILLKVSSFLFPVATWCLVSYTPFIWHPDIKLQVSADRDDVTTVFTAGNHLSRGYYSQFQEAIREDNQQILANRESGSETDLNASRVRRDNLKILRHLGPVAVKSGFLPKSQAGDDAAIFNAWKEIGQLPEGKHPSFLSAENAEVIRRNWHLMSSYSTEFNSRSLPDVPLEKLIPQGRRANPVYLPAPHEVILTGWEDFSHDPGDGSPTMLHRYLHSLKIVFMGFLFSALVGVPLGILAGTFDFFSKLLEPFIDFFRYMPAPAFSTLLVAIFLAHDAPKIALVFVGTFFQMVLVVANTTRQVDFTLIEAAQTLGARGLTLMRRVIIPGITPNLYNDLRILLGWSWTWLVIAELIGVKSGLTEFIETQGRWRNFDSVFPVIILIGMTGFLMDQFLGSLRFYLFPWAPDSAGSQPGPFGRFFSWLTDRSVYGPPMNGREAS